MKQTNANTAEHHFFFAAALILLGTALLGFSRTLYLRPWFPERVAASPPEAIFLWHGAACSAWLLLLTAQTWLTSNNALRSHRRLGWLAVIVIPLVALTGWLAMRTGATRPGGFVGVPIKPEHFLIVPLGDLVFVVVLTTLGFLARRTPAAHKRFMLLGTLPMMDAAIFRWPFDFASGNPPIEALAKLVSNSDLVLLLYLLPLLAWDWLRLGRIHPVTGWSSLALVSYVLLRMPLGETEAWQFLARILLGT
ncbi:MAG: hypothetical protein WCT47_19280 [Betaproteobacteria bacterium]